MARLETGKGKYEVGVYENGSLVGIFRTDSKDCIDIIKRTARESMEKLQEEHPDRKYELKRL